MGIDLSITQYLLIVFVSVVGSAATAGPTGATVMLTSACRSRAVGLLLAIDPILDMGRTAVNVTGRALVPTLVARQQGILDIDPHNAGEDIEVLATENEPLGAVHPVPAE